MSDDHEISTTISIVAGVICDAQGRTLLVRKRGTQFFMQPGGKPEPGEFPLDTLARELEEELGCAIDRESAEHFGSFEAPAANEVGHIVAAELYRVTLLGQVSPSSEVEEIKWVAAHNPEGLQLASLTAECVLARFKRRTKAA